MSASDHLTEKQRKFVEAYLTSGNASAAYAAAGYTGRGATARVNASRMLTNAKIQQALAQRRARLASANDVTPERVIQEWGRIAFFSLRDAATWTRDGLVVTDAAALSADAAAAIAEVDMIPTPDGMRLKLKAHSKTAALKALSDHLDLFGTREALEQFGQGLMGLVTRNREQHPNGHKAPAS